MASELCVVVSDNKGRKLYRSKCMARERLMEIAKEINSSRDQSKLTYVAVVDLLSYNDTVKLNEDLK